jgi:DHA1 family inner membrane transport protein
MGAAVNQSAMNFANSLGAAVGSLVIARGFGYLAPAWASVALAGSGLGLAAAGFALDRQRPMQRLPAQR